MNTVAVMKRNDTPKRKEEIWVMYADFKNPKPMPTHAYRQAGGRRAYTLNPIGSKIMISAWRYPGKSKPGKEIPIPDDILNEIQKTWFE